MPSDDIGAVRLVTLEWCARGIVGDPVPALAASLPRLLSS